MWNRWTDSTNYNHTFCQWWLLVVIKNFSQVFIVLAQLLKYLQIDCNILPWHWSPLCYWPFVRGIHWSSMDSPHKRLAAQALIFSLMLAWTNCWTNMPVPGYLTRYDTHVKVFANLLQYLSFTGHARRQKKEDTSQASRRWKGRRNLSSTRRYVMGHVGWWWWCGGGGVVVARWWGAGGCGLFGGLGQLAGVDFGGCKFGGPSVWHCIANQCTVKPTGHLLGDFVLLLISTFLSFSAAETQEQEEEN